jgi:hypothetical protein
MGITLGERLGRNLYANCDSQRLCFAQCHDCQRIAKRRFTSVEWLYQHRAFGCLFPVIAMGVTLGKLLG